MRYTAYTLEKSIVRGTRTREQLANASLYVLLTGSLCSAALDWTIAEAAAGGVDIVQMREKKLEDRELYDRARKMRHWTRDAGVLFFINDRPDIARLVDADGIHLGQDDLSVSATRRIIGPDMFIGVSTHNIGQLRQAILDGADYVGIGPVFPSKTKAFDKFAGLEFVREASRETSLPMFALGGVQQSNVTQIIEAGCRRVAVSSAIATAENPRSAAAELKHILTHPPESPSSEQKP